MSHIDFTRIWNDSIVQRPERPLEKRDHIWASELGKAPIDIWLRMRATEPTNPPNARSQRKFEAGNVFEWIVGLVLRRAGILFEQQTRCEYQYNGLLKVTGKIDFLTWGDQKPKVDPAEIESDIDASWLPDVFKRAAGQLSQELARVGPATSKGILEIKSCSSFMLDRYEAKRSASRNHRLQLFHYLKSTGLPHGEICYICRDDLRMFSVPVFNPSVTEEEYIWHITEISDYHKSNTRPPLEKPIVWDPDTGRFSENWQIKYSLYLKMLYGYPDQKAFEDLHKPIVARWNRVMGRLRNADKMTDKNKLALEEMQTAGHDPEKLLAEFAPEQPEEEQ